MPDERRSRGRAQSGGRTARASGSSGERSRGPGRTPTRRPAARGAARTASGSGAGSATTRKPAPGRGAGARRPRFTGRAAVLVMVLAVLAVSYASSLRAYLQQRSEIDDLRAKIAASRSGIDDLEREKQRWRDPAFVAAQARERFGYVAPGETPFVVVDKNGDPLDAASSLSDPDSIGRDRTPTAWYEDVWSSVEVAGHPPTKAPAPPLTRIDGSDEPTGD